MIPMKAAEAANLHEALFYLCYDNARIHAGNQQQQPV
jgi:hypothetical protein